MRKLLPLSLLTLLLSIPLYAEQSRSQSYFTYDDGGTIVRQGDDNQEVEARVNFPVYPGDEVTTSRRGRAEIRLSDGNVIALDRGTQIRFSTIRDAYDADGNNQTVIELRYGHVMLQRDNDDRTPVRLDTESASFAATERAIYSVDTERERGAVRVYDGSIEVRTPSRTTRVRAGEEGRLDDQGLYDLVSVARGGADDFERWFLHRSGQYRGASSRYLDSTLAYSDQDLGRNGSWVYVNDYGSWCWRPTVSVGWRPYYNGYWHHGRNCLTWISYEPWGWVPYHYGRWGYDPGYGWVWLPGYTYSPAWVYWMYGPNYIGWAPAGWYDCYRPYYSWAYRPYSRAGFEFGFGFYGRVRVREIDLRPWTFVSPGSIVSTRVDRAALTTDVIRQRLNRDGGSMATVSGAPARFTRSEIRDPASAVNNIVHRGSGSGTGKEGSGSAADMTPFFRRDPALSPAVRDRVVRSRGDVPASAFTPRGVGAGVPTPGTGGTLEGRVPRDGGGNRHNDPPAGGTIQRGTGGGTVGGAVGDWRHGNPPKTTAPTPAPGTVKRGEGGGTTTTTPRDNWRNRDGGGTVHRGDTPSTTPPPQPRDTTKPRDTTTPRERGTVRDRVDRPPADKPATGTPPPPSRDQSVNRDNWRGRGSEGTSRGTVREGSSRDSGRSSDVPRRIIDGIGGARITSGDRPARSSGGNSTPPPRSSTPPPARSSGGGEHHSSPPPEHHNNNSGGSEHVKRN